MMDKSQAAASIFNKHAVLYQGKFMNVDLYGNTFDFFCDNISKQNPEILELACGPGNITSYLLNKRPDLKILGTDLAPNMIQLAQQNNPSAQFQILDCRELSKNGRLYDGIMCGFCLPYIDKNETQRLFSDSYSALNTGGLLYISTMEDNYEKSGYRRGSQGDEIYMHYYEMDFLTEALKENRFEILFTDRKISEMTDGSRVTDLIIIAKK